jgi:oligosaccharide repeat unit polymerase
MSNVVVLALVFAILFGLAPSALGGLRNARGVFVAYFLGGVVIPAAISFSAGHGSADDVYEIVSGDGIKALVLCSMAFFITVWLSIGIERASLKPRLQTIFQQDRGMAVFFAWLSIAMNVLYVVSMSIRFGGIVEMTYRLYQRISLLDSVANFLSIFSYGSFVFAIFSVSFARGLRGFPLYLAWTAAILFLGQSLLLGGRSIVVLFFVAVFYTSIIKLKLGKAAMASIAALALFGTISYFMTNWRFEAQGGGGRRAEAGADFAETATTGLTFVDHVAASIAYSRDRGHDYGKLYFNTLLLPIPRDMWPNKPLQISVEMREYLYGDITGGNPPGLFGEAYIAFGSFGLLGAGALLGLLIGQINLATMRSIRYDCRLRAAITGILGPLYGFALVRGGIDIGLMRVGIPAIWCGIAWFLVRNRGVTFHVRALEAKIRAALAQRAALRAWAAQEVNEDVAGRELRAQRIAQALKAARI